MSREDSPILEMKDVTISYGRKLPPSAKSISFSMYAGECLGLVGASGCGKSTIGKALVGLLQPLSGSILWKGRDIKSFSAQERMEYRRNVQMVFQDTLGALNPQMRVGDAIEEVLKVHAREQYATQEKRRARVAELLERVELSPELAKRWPDELSGGQRQRIGIARSLACSPEVLLCDEPVSALDVAVQAQILRMLDQIAKEDKLALLFVSHDLAVVHCLCPKVLVMEKGEIVERGATQAAFENPKAEFTKQLLAAAFGPAPAAQ